MKAEIICWNTKDKIKISNDNGLFEQVSKSNDKKYFVHFDNDIIKIIDTDKKAEDIYNYYLKDISSHLFFIVSEINEENYNLINKIILKKNCIVIAGRIEIENYDMDNLKNKIALLPQLFFSEDKINVKSIILLIENLIKENILEDYLLGSTIILGNKEIDEPLGNIPLTILKNFNYIREIKGLELNVYSSAQLSIQELIHIKDPIMEYLPYGSMLKINQMIYNGIDGKIYYSLISK